jgi:hypothetical protein
VRAVELWWNLQVRSCKPDPLGPDIVHLREDRRNGAGLAGRFALTFDLTFLTPHDQDNASPADAQVVTRFDDVLLLLLASRILSVDRLHCFGSGSLSNFRLSFEYVIARQLAGNRLFSAFTLA